MHIIFIQKDIFESYGLMLLSAVLKKQGHCVEVLVDAAEPSVVDKVREKKPDIVAFSITSARYSWLRQRALAIRAISDAKIIVGGPHPTFFPEMINEDFVDIICIGEGEAAFLELLRNLELGENITNIKNLYVKEGDKIYKNEVRNLLEDLDSLPFADRHIYDAYPIFRMQRAGTMLAARGCPYYCTFCFNKKYNMLYKNKGRLVRRRSVSNVIDEMKFMLKEKKQLDYFLFHDDTFIVAPAEWLDEFCRRVKKDINMPFGINVRVNLINEGLVKKLKVAGCVSMRFGVESADPHLREGILKKGITNEQIFNAARIIKKHKIKFQIFNMLGLPEETLQKALQTYEMSRSLHPEHAWCALLAPYPGTEIADIALEKELLPKDYDFSCFENSYFDSIPLLIENKNAITNLQKLFQAGNLLRIPKSIMRFIIALPPNRLFEQIFKINYALGVKRMDNLSWSYLAKSAFYFKDYIKKKD